MKNILKLILTLFAVIGFASCDTGSMKDADKLKPADEVAVAGPVTVLKTGTLTAQSSTNTKGMVQVVSNAEGKLFIRLTEDFTRFHPFKCVSEEKLFWIFWPIPRPGKITQITFRGNFIHLKL